MEDSSNRRTLEEEIYWQNFHFARFFLKLTSDFHHQITLPNKFSYYMRTKLPEQIVLKVNRVTWNVNLKKGKDNIVLHGREWEELVSAYSLKKSDVLMFKYNRRECFEVFLYDGTSSCEKEASYFIKKDDQEKNSDDDDHDISRKTKDKLSKRHITNTPRSRNRNNNSVKTACARDLSDKSDDVKDMEASSDEENSISKEVMTPLKKAAATRERDLENRGHNVGTLIPHISDVSEVKGTPQKKPIAIYALRYESNRRPVTSQEVKNAWNKAMEASNLHRNSFVVVMRPSCVYRRFFMTIPAAWKPANVFKKNQEVTLKIKEKTWLCRASYNRETTVGFESVGWKDFTRENFLEEHDVCLFYPSSDSNDKNYVLNVRIFRVVSEVVPPTLVCPKDDLSKGNTANTSRNRNRNIPAQTACARDCSDNFNDLENSDEGTSTSEEVMATPKKDAADRERDSRKRKRSVVKITTQEKRAVIHAVCYESKRRPVTDQEVEDALNKATEASELYINSFVVVMRPSAVYKRFFMRIPAAWKPMEVFKKNQEVILKVKEKAWVCIVSFSGEVTAGFQCMGWKDFVRDNVLEEHDVCLFVPSDRNDGKYVLDVSIFRVVSEVVPPTVVNS